MDLSRINNRESELNARLRWMRQREDMLISSKSKSELVKLRAEIQSITNELRAIRTRRSRFLYDVSDGH